jgi:hypothetical protein
LCWPRNTLYPQKLALSSPISGGSSVCKVRSRTESHGVCFCFIVRIVWVTYFSNIEGHSERSSENTWTFARLRGFTFQKITLCTVVDLRISNQAIIVFDCS